MTSATATLARRDPDLAPPTTWRWTPSSLLLAAGGLLTGLGITVAVTTRPDLGLPLLVLIVGGLGGLGLAALASTRFVDYLAVLLVVRTSLDYVKPEGGPSFLEPTSAVGALSVVLGLTWLTSEWRARRLVPASRLTLALVGMSAVALVNPLFAVGRVESFQSAMKFLSFTVIFAVFEQLFRRQPQVRERLLRTFLWSLALPALMAFVQLARDSGVDEYLTVGRVRGTFAHPNPFGTYLAMVIIVALVVADRSRALRKVGALGVCAVAAGCLLFTYSRGAWAAAIIGVVVFAWRMDRRILRYLVAATVLLVLAVPSIATRLADLDGDYQGVANEDRNSLAWRVGYWEDIFPLGLSSPVGGIGLDSTQLVREEQLAPHNVFVQSFVELGLPGLVALLLVLVAGINEIHRSDYWARDRWERGLSAAASAVGIGFFLQMFSENLLTQPTSLWYFALVVSAALANGWADSVSPRAIRGELSIRQRLSVFLEERRRPDGAAIRALEGTDISARIKDILGRNADRQDRTGSSNTDSGE